ncbi:hypothetical protein BV25DRAFT_1357572 [Artomyces pyxidatus]|uniref:Uncharacterized protein n=1 Tax=Artomyces pyxidatus TaxID=48021 RepID=A0ACB8SPC5_9AGAM|nr:hypothetical protein BV25DRAFT_1357572 [Artomyces pyxidatus]
MTLSRQYIPLKPRDLLEESPEDVSRQIIDNFLLNPDLTTTEITEFGGFAHGECALFAYLLKEGVMAYPYLGTSGQPCQACILFFRSYRSAASESPLHYLVNEARLHMKLFPSSWVSPLLADEAIHSGAQRNLTEYMKISFDVYVTTFVDWIIVKRRSSSDFYNKRVPYFGISDSD